MFHRLHWYYNITTLEVVFINFVLLVLLETIVICSPLAVLFIDSWFNIIWRLSSRLEVLFINPDYYCWRLYLYANLIGVKVDLLKE